MNQFELLQNISKYLARFSEQVQITNADGTFHLNIHAENILVGLLNTTYDLELVNVNAGNRNYPAIDLLDKKRGVAFQVTSTADMAKIKKTIATFFASQTYKEVAVLNIYLLTRKINSTQSVIDDYIKKEKNNLVKNGVIAHPDDVQLSFSVKENIFDIYKLRQDLVAANDFEKIKKVEWYLKTQFDLIAEEDDLSKYHEGLYNMYYEVVMNDESGMALSHIYVEPGFSLHCHTIKQRNLKSGEDKFHKADHRYKIHEFLDDYLAGKNHLKCVYPSRMFLILGYPGQGKSSFLKRFVHDYIESGKNSQQPVYYFQLRNIRDVKGFIDKPLDVLYEEACTMLETKLDRYRFNKSFLLLDGLDELYMRENLKLDEIDKVCKELILLTEKFEQLNIIVTSRYGYVDDEKLLKEKILIIQLAEFQKANQLEWLDKFKVFHPDTWLTRARIQEIDSEPHFRYMYELIKQPILLHMIATLSHEINGHANRASIYSQMFTELISRSYSKDGQIEMLKMLTEADLRSFLREVAFGIYQTGEEYITKRALLKLDSTRDFLRLFPGDNFSDSIKGVMVSFYFRETMQHKEPDYEEDRSDYAIEFLHKSLKEYLVAEKIVYSLAAEFLEKKSSSGKYIIDDGALALQVINNLLAKSTLTEEIKRYMIEIIRNDTTLPKDILSDRILIHLDYYLDKGFLSGFNAEIQRSPIELSCNCFTALWTMVSALGLKRNYFNSWKMKQEFLSLLTHSYLVDEFNIMAFDFSFQDLTHVNFMDIKFYVCLFIQTDFSDAEFNNVAFHDCMMDEVRFTGAMFSNCEINSCEVEKSNFNDVNLFRIIIDASSFSECDFSRSILNIEVVMDKATKGSKRFVFNKCIFYKVVLYGNDLAAIKLHSDKITSSKIIADDEYDKREIKPLITPPEVRKNGMPDDYKRLMPKDNVSDFS